MITPIFTNNKQHAGVAIGELLSHGYVLGRKIEGIARVKNRNKLNIYDPIDCDALFHGNECSLEIKAVFQAFSQYSGEHEDIVWVDAILVQETKLKLLQQKKHDGENAYVVIAYMKDETLCLVDVSKCEFEWCSREFANSKTLYSRLLIRREAVVAKLDNAFTPSEKQYVEDRINTLVLLETISPSK